MEMLFLLKNLYRDPLALSRFSQFRYLHIGKGEIIQNLNENHEFQVCFVLTQFPHSLLQSVSFTSVQACNIKAASETIQLLNVSHFSLLIFIYFSFFDVITFCFCGSRRAAVSPPRCRRPASRQGHIPPSSRSPPSCRPDTLRR